MPQTIKKLPYKLVPVEEIHDHPDNPRTHTQADIEELAEIIDSVGWTDPVILNADGVLLSGHRRKAAAIYLELTKIPAIYRADLTEEQQIHALIYSNSSVLQGDWADDLLTVGLEQLKAADENHNHLNVGFSGTELKAIFDKKAQAKKKSKKKSSNNTSGTQQIMLFYPQTKYDDIIDALDEWVEQEGVSSYSELVAKWLEVDLT